MFSKTIFFIIGFYFFTLPSFSQQSNDAGMWATLSLQHPLNKKISLVVDQEFRLKENYQRINLFYTNLGIDYKFNKYLKISPTYRAIQKND